jgi:Protein of unknown function (DUF1444)
MERDSFEREQGGSDVGRDFERDYGDEPAPAFRDAAPDYLAPIDDSAPVSGHVPAPAASGSAADTPEHDWEHARNLVYPAFRPVGTQGEPIESFDLMAATADGRSHTQPLVDEGPAGLPVVYALDAGAFDVIVSGDHLRTWGIGPADLQDAAMRNLTTWSASAPWTDEISGERRLVSSDTGDGWDAARILLPDVVDHLTRELGPHGRILIGVPERHLLVAGSLRPNDDEFASLFADFVLETSGGADEPVDRRVFELVDGRLVEFAGVAAR